MFNIPEASLTSDWWTNTVTSLLIDNVENNENNRGQRYPLQGVTGFNQVVIKLQLILDIAFCDYEEEKERKITRCRYWHLRVMLDCVIYCVTPPN